MKKIIVVLFLFAVKATLAQGNLQFNDVKMITLEVTQQANGVSDSISVSFTIPANTVWKIEECGSSTFSSSLGGIGVNSAGRLILDDDILIYSPNGNMPNGRFGNPIWIGAGQHKILLVTANGTLGGYNFKGFLNALEFNIVP